MSSTPRWYERLQIAFLYNVAALLLATYVGRQSVTPALHSAFLDAARTAFTIFATLCVIGTFASLARGKVR